MSSPTNNRVRTTVSLNREVAAAARRLQEEKNISMSEAVNELASAGLRRSIVSTKRIELPDFSYAPRIDVTNIGEVLGMLEEEEWLNDR